MARRVIFPAVMALWGLSVVIHHLTASTPSDINGAYHAGQTGAAWFGALMAVVGTVYAVRGLRNRG
ncbi:MAG TPA: hypothetical protein VF545_09705 [Thermoleophilaceae bacterium]|jgi:hypothetical protein